MALKMEKQSSLAREEVGWCNLHSDLGRYSCNLLIKFSSEFGILWYLDVQNSAIHCMREIKLKY